MEKKGYLPEELLFPSNDKFCLSKAAELPSRRAMLLMLNAVET